MNARMENAHKWIKLVVDVITLIIFASVILGYVMIRTYLSNFRTFISPLDTFSASSLQIFGILFIVLLGSAVFFFLVPFCAPYIVSPETRESLQELFGRRNIPPHTLRPRTFHNSLKEFYNFLKEYAMFYLPTLGVISVMPILMSFEIVVEKFSGSFCYHLLSRHCFYLFIG